jgi:hypothetical protein
LDVPTNVAGSVQPSQERYDVGGHMFASHASLKVIEHVCAQEKSNVQSN